MERLKDIYMGIIRESSMEGNMGAFTGALVEEPIVSENGVMVQQGERYAVTTGWKNRRREGFFHVFRRER